MYCTYLTQFFNLFSLILLRKIDTRGRSEKEKGKEVEKEKDKVSDKERERQRGKVALSKVKIRGLECRGQKGKERERGRERERGNGPMSPMSRDFKSFPLSSAPTAHHQLPQSLPPTMPYPSIREVAK